MPRTTSILCPVRILSSSVPVLPPSNNTLPTPNETRHQHQPSRNPSQHQKLISLIGADANILAVLIDDIGSLDSHSGRDSAGQAHSDESQPVDQHVDESTQATIEEDAEQSETERNEDEGNGNAVQHECCSLRNPQRREPAVDRAWPVQIGEIDVAVPTRIELFLQRNLRIEGVQRACVAAASYILLDVFARESSIRDRGGRVEALTVVKEVHRVEVMKSELLGEGVQVIVNVAFDGVREVVQEGCEYIAAAAARGVQDILANAGGVEL